MPEKLYDWRDGKGKIHSIPLRVHRENLRVNSYGLSPNQPLSAPFTPGQAVNYAESAADREVGPAIRANQQLYNATPGWFQNYRNSITASQQAQQAYAQPLLDTANAQVANAGQTAPGLDASSPQFAADQEAAKARAALASLGSSTLAAIPAASNAYMAGLQTTAARDLPGAMAYLKTEGAGLQQQRGDVANKALGDLRTGAQNYDLARATLLGNQANDAAQIDLNRGVDPVTGQPLPADPVSPGDQKTAAELKYFKEHGYWPPTGPPAKPKPKKTPGLTPAQKQAAQEKEATRVAGIRTESGKVLSRVQDALGAWAATSKTPVKTGRTIKDKDGNDVEETRPPKPSERKTMLYQQGYEPGLVHVMLLRNANPPRPLDQQAIDYLHAKNVRIPREWLPYDPDLRAGSKKDPKPTGAGK